LSLGPPPTAIVARAKGGTGNPGGVCDHGDGTHPRQGRNNQSYSWSTIEVDAYSKLAVGPLSSSSDSGSGSTAGEAGGLHFMPA